MCCEDACLSPSAASQTVNEGVVLQRKLQGIVARIARQQSARQRRQRDTRAGSETCTHAGQISESKIRECDCQHEMPGREDLVGEGA